MTVRREIKEQMRRDADTNGTTQERAAETFLDLHTARRRPDEMFRAKFCKDTRDHLADRTDAVGEILGRATLQPG